MKKILFSILVLSGLFSLTNVSAQSSFSVQDTVRYSYYGTGIVNFQDDIDNLSTVVSDSVVITWKVIYSDFPTDWIGATGICDNYICYPFTGLYPSEAPRTSSKYPDGMGDFHLQLALTTTTPTFDASAGTHYITVRMHNSAIPNDSATTTFVISKVPASVPAVNKTTEDILLYPNPAMNEVNVVYDASSDIKNISVYNIIGKTLTVYKVSGNSANLNIENLPSGIYFVRLFNSGGNVVATRKFTKQ